jgi:alpha-ketoglutarate-dependent taurine dioxygenase
METQLASIVKISSLKSGQQLPLLIEPAEGAPNDASTLKHWLEENKAFINQKIIEHGAILFRGFDVNGPEQFENVAQGVDPDLKNNYLGTSPRNAVSKYVFSASELPPYYPIMQHCEMSFLPNPPRKLFFYCHIEPTEGGETPIVDFRKVYQDLDPMIREEFERKGIKNVRNYNGPSAKAKFDLWKLKRWDEMFLTTDKKVVEESCKKNGLEFHWKDDDKLVLINDQEAIAKHPITGEKVWFNHLQVFHEAAAAIEYGYIAKRQKNLRAASFNVFTSLMSSIKKLTTKEGDQAMNCTFRDGTPIPVSYVKHVEEVIWKNMVIFSWRKGDVLAIDNFSTSLGRLQYNCPREIQVCWAADN